MKIKFKFINWFVFKEVLAYKKEMRRSHPRYEQGQVSSTTATNEDVVGVLSAVFIVAKSDTRNREYQLLK